MNPDLGVDYYQRRDPAKTKDPLWGRVLEGLSDTREVDLTEALDALAERGCGRCRAARSRSGAFWPVALSTLPGRDEDLMQHVLGVGDIAEQAQGDGVDERGIAPIERLERLLVTGSETLRDLVVVIVERGHADAPSQVGAHGSGSARTTMLSW